MPQHLRLVHSTAFSFAIAASAAMVVLTAAIWTPNRFATFVVFVFSGGAFSIVWGVLQLVEYNTRPPMYNQDIKNLTEADKVYVTVTIAIFRILTSLAVWAFLTKVRELGVAHVTLGVIAVFVMLMFADRIATGKVTDDTKNISIAMCVVVFVLVVFF